MKERPTVIFIFYDEHGRVLLQDRRGYSKWGEEWAFFGGGIEPGETPEQALVREVKEELSYDLTEWHFYGVSESGLHDTLFIRYIYFIPLGDKLPKFNLTEGSGMRLYGLDEVQHLKLIPSSQAYIDASKDFLRRGK